MPDSATVVGAIAVSAPPAPTEYCASRLLFCCATYTYRLSGEVVTSVALVSVRSVPAEVSDPFALMRYWYTLPAVKAVA